jgi:hypothetical protein
VKLKIAALVIFVGFLMVMCKHEIPFDGSNGNGAGNSPTISNTCNSDSVYFANTILPLLSSGCAMSGCHDAITHEEGLVLNNYTGIMRIVHIGNAHESKLYKVITTTSQGDIMPPPPHSPLSSANVSAIQKWINQGAKNNQCIAACDSSVFTFSGAVLPIINTFCKGCHNPASLGGGIDLSSYNAMKIVALNGKLSGSINHKPGYVAMPQGGNKLQDCQIKQIEKWIVAGALNN